ncbi:MAG: beta-galactosidase [Anaerolineae bacterium]|nr:beta-galactosidase [Anaerolineae bacterium]
MTRYDVRPHHGAPTLFEDDAPIFPAVYMVSRPRLDSAGRAQLDPDLQAMREAGFRLLMMDMPVRFDHAYDLETGEFPSERFAPLGEALRAYAREAPEARWLVRVFVEPRGEDSAWLRAHPDDWERLEARAKGIYTTPSFASQAWLQDAGRFLEALVGYLRDQDLYELVAGYLVCAGDSAEWVKIGPMEDWAGDYSPAMQVAFHRWLRHKYGTIEALRGAWGDDKVSFDDDLVPTPEEQGATDLFLFKDPSKRRRAIDYWQCQAHIVARDIDALCGVVKRATQGERLAGVFYGYLLEIIWNNGFFGQRLADADVAHTAAARSGHAGLAEVLASPHVDFLSSPYSYGWRGIGGEGGFMAPVASVRRAGKLWISEEDTRTHLSRPDAYYGRTHNAEETCAVLKRQCAQILTHSAGGWWCQWSAGSWADPQVLETFRRTLELGRHQLSLPDRASAAEIAVVVDAESWFYRSTLNNLDIPNWRNRAWGMARLGAPVEFVLLSDLLAGRAREYRFYYMWNVFQCGAQEREQLKALLRRDGKLALWIYAPGFVGDADLSAAYCRDLTGIRLTCTERQWGVNIFLSNFQHPVTHNLPTSTFWGTDTRLGPLFTVDDPDAVTLGTAVINQGRCEPGFVLLQKQDWASAYSAAPNPPPGVLRELARHAGVHIYSDSEDVLYADSNYVMLHTVRAGLKWLHLPRPADVWEVYSRRLVARQVTCFDVSMQAGATHLFYYGPEPLP